MRRLAFAIVAIALSLAGAARAQPIDPGALGDPHLAAALDRLQQGGVEELRASVVEQRAHLTSLSREANAAAWANAQEELGNTLLALSFQEFGEMIRGRETHDSPAAAEAEAAFGAGLEVVSREREPLRWARMQVKLAMVLLWQPSQHSTWEVVEHLRAALPAFRQAGARFQWAITQLTIAQGLQYAARNDESALAAAIEAADAGADELGALRMSEESQGARMIADNLRQMQAEVRSFRDRVTAFSSSNPNTLRASDARQWALANLAFAETLLDEAEDARWTGIGRYGFVWEEIASLIRASLDVLNRDAAPLDWARAQHNLGRAFQGKDREQDRRAALAAYRAALSVLDPEPDSEAWARSQGRLVQLLNVVSRYDESVGPEALVAAHAIFEHNDHVRMGDVMVAMEIVSRFEGETRAEEYLERLDD
jgi:hypothetical protein